MRSAADRASFVCDLLKHMRSRWQTVDECAAALGVTPQGARPWVLELSANGLIVARERARAPHAAGAAPLE